MAQKPKLDYTQLTHEQRRELREDENTKQQLQHLSDIADMTQEVINQLDDQNKDDGVTNLGVLLVDIKESLTKLNSKDAPKIPDYAKPVVASVTSLEKKLSAAIKGIDVKPNVKVEAPKVELGDTVVDLKGVEEILREELPKAFNEAISLMPQSPEADNSELLAAWAGISEQLQSIDTATRKIPQAPTQLKVTNPDGTLIEPFVAAKDFNHITIANTDTDEDTMTYKTGGPTGTTVRTLVIGFASGAEKISDSISTLDYS